MDRLTKVIDGSVVFPSELVGVTLTPGNDTMHELLTRLAAYEDTGLDPEEVAGLVQAKQDGRLVVQDIFALWPIECGEACKEYEGDELCCEGLRKAQDKGADSEWRFMAQNCPKMVEVVGTTPERLQLARDGNPGKDGILYFLTREAAETALEGENNET